MEDVERLKKVLETVFGMEGFDTFEPINRGGVNKIWKASNTRETFILKQTRTPPCAEWCTTASNTLRHLKKDCFPVPDFYPSNTNLFFSEMDGQGYQLQKFVPSQETPFANEKALKSVAKFLKDLQNVDMPFIVPSPRNDIEGWLEDFADRRSALLRMLERYLTKSEIQIVDNTLNVACKYLDQHSYNKLNNVLSHGELQGTNLFIGEDCQLDLVLDWDSLQQRPRIYDIATSGFFLSRKSRGKFEIDHKLFINYVSSFSGTIDEEYKFITPVLALYVLPTPHLLETMIISAPYALDWYIPWFMQATSSIKELPSDFNRNKNEH